MKNIVQISYVKIKYSFQEIIQIQDENKNMAEIWAIDVFL